MPLGRPSDAGDNGVFFGGCESTIAQVRPGWAESAVGALGNASEEKKKKWYSKTSQNISQIFRRQRQ